MQRDLTKGNLLKNIVVFSLPFLLSYFLQTLYGMADLFIVGQFDGANVISGVAIGSQVMHMITVMLVGVATGGAVMIGRYVGAHDKENVSKTIGNTITLFVIIAAILTALLLLLVSPIVTIMSTPKEAIVETSNYLKICFIGIPFIIAYNVISSIFRGMGDSKSPMYFIAVACVVNIALIIAQAFSVIVAIITIVTKQLIQLSFSSLKFEKETITSILKIGIPVSLQDGFIQVAFLIITIIANSRGVEISAAVGIVEKIISFLFLVPSTMMQTVSTISSQAIGAGKKALARKTLFTSMAISTSIGLIFAISFQFISEPVIALFTHDAQVVQLATGYMHSYVFDCAIASMHFCFSGFFVASGYSIVSFIHNVASIITLRVPGAYLASIYYPKTLFPMGLAAPAGGVLQLAICIGFYRYLRKKNKI